MTARWADTPAGVNEGLEGLRAVLEALLLAVTPIPPLEVCAWCGCLCRRREVCPACFRWWSPPDPPRTLHGTLARKRSDCHAVPTNHRTPEETP